MNASPTTWRTFRPAWRPICRLIYLLYLPLLALNAALAWSMQDRFLVTMIAVSLPLIIVLAPLVALLIPKLVYWQVCEVGLRFVTPAKREMLTWDEMECVRRHFPGPITIYYAEKEKAWFLSPNIPLAPSVMEDFAAFAQAIECFAPEEHTLQRFVESPGEHFPAEED